VDEIDEPRSNRPPALCLDDSPIQIDIQQVEQRISPLLVSVSTNRVQKVSDSDIASNDRVVRPFGSEVDNAAWRVHKDVLSHDPGGLGLGQLFAGEDSEESGFTGWGRG